MDLETALTRFMYFGTIKCYYVKPRSKLLLTTYAEYLECIKVLALKDLQKMLEIIKDAITRKKLFRNDEAIFVLAFCARKLEDNKMKNLIYTALPSILKEQKDFFAYINYFQKLNDRNGTGFGHGMRNAIKKWYISKTADEMADMIAINRKLHTWSHKDLLVMAHVRFPDRERTELKNALFKNGTEYVRLLEERQRQMPTHVAPTAVLRLTNHMKFRVCESAVDALKIIKETNYKIEHIPIHLLQNKPIWQQLITKFTYSDMLKYLQTMSIMNLLALKDPLSVKIAHFLENVKKIEQEKIHPMKIVLAKCKYEKNQPFANRLKAKYYKSRLVRRKTTFICNPSIVQKLEKGMNFAFHQYPQTNLRYFITVDLKERMQKRHVFGLYQLTCFDVLRSLAITYIKREKVTKLYAFTDQSGVLKEIEVPKNASIENMTQSIKQESIKLSKYDIMSPFKYAGNKKYDVFITIVDSLGIFMRKNQISTMKEFYAYREHVNPNAKYIICNLCRKKPDLNLEEPNNKGILEICGVDSNMPELINLFGTGIIS